MAEVLTEVTGRDIDVEFISLEERTQRAGDMATFGDVWSDQVGYPARPHHATAYGPTTTTFTQWQRGRTGTPSTPPQAPD